ncbi:hypothetical protein [Leptolyngbya iicbica]|uniref:Uncharacterized protein n=2 Tax=Cyanophyceae TaxID=3028117 RepID=A0A4V2E3M3_9CYAN|nr:hypothetical protein [Leptolyngbya sp. LK]RZM82940.1 hypothetical protein DYY88_07015 [Leptolyngbya sp. LK]
MLRNKGLKPLACWYLTADCYISPDQLSAIAQRYDLQAVQQPLESKFSPPAWWGLPPGADYYLRGSGHQYLLRVFDPATGSVMVERTQD